MRVGSYDAVLQPGSKAAELYGSLLIHERHRHRYEVNIAYREAIEASGLRLTGLSPDGLLPEIVEREDHPWFVGVQFHPELKSRPFDPHPLYASFVAAAIEQSRLV
jgi:CTP synthase